MNYVIIGTAIGGPDTFYPTTEDRVIDALRRWLECSSLIDMAGIEVIASPKMLRFSPPGGANARGEHGGGSSRNGSLAFDDVSIITV